MNVNNGVIDTYYMVVFSGFLASLVGLIITPQLRRATTYQWIGLAALASGMLLLMLRLDPHSKHSIGFEGVGLCLTFSIIDCMKRIRLGMGSIDNFRDSVKAKNQPEQ